MNLRAPVLASLALLSAAVAGEHGFPRLSARVPHFEKRLRSTRWQVRYCLLGDLDDRDEESKRALELLSRDEHDAVASQALRHYERSFIHIDKFLFRPEVYFRGTQFLGREPAHGRELVERCLAWLRAARDAEEQAVYPLVHGITVVGVLGAPKDADVLHRFLDSKNDYVAIRAAVAAIRLGASEKGVDTLMRLTKRDPVEHLHYMTEALRLLKELEHPQYGALVLETLAAVDRTEGIQPNWLTHFLLLAAEIDRDVWTPKAASGEAGEAK